jgi:DNA polymerase-3 subunit alpha
MPLPASKIQLHDLPSTTSKEVLTWEKELLGLYVSDHPAAAFRDYLEARCSPIHHLEKEPDGKHVTIGGVITSVRKSLSKGGQPLAFVGIEDLSGRVELLVFGKTFERAEGLLHEDETVEVTLKVTHRDGILRLSAESVERLSSETVAQAKRVVATHAKYRQPETPLR